MKKQLKKCLIVCLFIMCIFSIVYAGDTNISSYDQIQSKIGPILNALSWFGYAISLGMFMYVGVKYMLSAAEDRARVKQGLIYFLIGAIIIAGAATFANIVSSFAMRGDASTDPAKKIVDTATTIWQ